MLLALLLVGSACRPQTNELFEKKVAEIRGGKSDELEFYGTQNTDELLQSIAGLQGVKKLAFARCVLTPKALQELVTLPDLASVSLYELPVTDAWIEALHSCAQLEELKLGSLSYRRNYRTEAFTLSEPGAPVSVSTVLRLAHLKKLTIDCPGKPGLKQLEEATHLQQLTLVGRPDDREVAKLREKLPNCEILVVPDWR
jgi:hypothetical protein